MPRLTLAVICLAALVGPRAALAADPVLPVFAAENFASPKANPYFPMESGTVEPDLHEFKYYAPGIGMIRADEELTEALDNPAIIVELQP